MNREQAKQKIEKITKIKIMSLEGIDLAFLINEIFDDFENRICKNCKYFEEGKSMCGDGYCNNEDWMFNSPPVYKEFGCNKFIKKDTK